MTSDRTHDRRRDPPSASTCSGPDDNLDQPDEYEIRVAGHLDAHWAPHLDAAHLAHDADGTTVLVVRDQTALHTALLGLRDIGAALLSVGRRSPSRAVGSAGHG